MVPPANGLLNSWPNGADEPEGKLSNGLGDSSVGELTLRRWDGRRGWVEWNSVVTGLPLFWVV